MRAWKSTISASKWRSNFMESWPSSYTRTCVAQERVSETDSITTPCMHETLALGTYQSRTRGGWMPVANRYWPSGVSLRRWQAAGNSRSWMSSILRLRHALWSARSGSQQPPLHQAPVLQTFRTCTLHLCEGSSSFSPTPIVAVSCCW